MSASNAVVFELNGVAKQLAAGASVADVVELLWQGAAGIAVACNGSIVPRSTWNSTLVADGDRFEVVTVVAGG